MNKEAKTILANEILTDDIVSSWQDLYESIGVSAVVTPSKLGDGFVEVVLEAEDKKHPVKIAAKIEEPIKSTITSKKEKLDKVAKSAGDTSEVITKDGKSKFNDELNKVEVELIAASYIYNHGKKPAGNGVWGFGINSRDLKDVVFLEGMFSRVQRQAEEIARKRALKEGKKSVKLHVMESVEFLPSSDIVIESKSPTQFLGKAFIDDQCEITLVGISESALKSKLESVINESHSSLISERVLSKKEEKKKEKVVTGIKSSAKSVKDMKARYGKDWKSVAYGAATNIAKKKKLKEDAEQTFKIFYADPESLKNVDGTYKDVQSVEVNAETKQDAIDYVQYKYGPVKIIRSEVIGEEMEESEETIKEDALSFQIEYELTSPDGTVQKGTKIYNALNQAEARNRFIKDYQIAGKRVAVRSIKQVNESIEERSQTWMDVHDMAHLIMKEAYRYAQAMISRRRWDDEEHATDDEGGRPRLEDDALEDAVYDYIEELQHHLKDNRTELTDINKIRQYINGVSESLEEAKKPSAGLSDKKKSEVVKKAKAGKDIGKKGEAFKNVAKKAAKEYGSKEAGEKVAAAAMWKNVNRESVDPMEIYSQFISSNNQDK